MTKWGELANIPTDTGIPITRVHRRTNCLSPDACCIHSPSDHPLREAPLYWRHEIQIMERICEHGIGHPDPDVAYRRRSDPTWAHRHGCDGCCTKG